MKLSLEKKQLFFFLFAVIALVSILINLYYSTQRVKLSGDKIEHTQLVLQKSDDILLDVLNIQTGSRGYMLTGKRTFLAPFYLAVLKISLDLRELKQLTKDNPIQQQRINLLKNAGEQGLVFTKRSIEMRERDELNETEILLLSEKEKILNIKVRNIIAKINSEEFRLLKLRKIENEKNAHNSEILFIFLFVFIVIILALATLIIYHQRTRNKFADRERQVSEYSRSLIEASLDPLVTISVEGKITDVNEASVKVTGIPREKLINTDFSDYFTEPEKAQEGYHQVFEKGFVADYPLTIKNVSGILTDVMYNASVYKDNKGNVLGIFAAARDVSQQKIAVQLSEERTTQLESANKELEAFSYSVSHDLRAPLRAINGYAKILQEDYTEKLDEEGIDSLRAILKSSKRMGDLIDDLLAFSRLGRKVVTASDINMTVLVKSVLEEEKVGSNKKTEIILHDLINVQGQQVLIKQVWANLISNAFKYSQHEDKPKIEIGSYIKDCFIVYYVKDNGAGFDMQYYDKLFGVFQRLHSNEEFEGTGIGLAIAQKIIKNHGGSIWADSKVKEGSCFYFSLLNVNT